LSYDKDVKALDCACSNTGVAVYSVVREIRKLADVIGNFQRSEGKEPAIICGFCQRPIQKP